MTVGYPRRHPSQEALALYSARDLPLVSRWRVAYHVAHCADCERQVLLFGPTTAELKREARTETLTSFEAIADWRALEREMLGNIRVGVDAARCIAGVGARRAWPMRFALVSSLLILFAAGWITHIPGEQTRHLFASLATLTGFDRPAPVGTVLRSTPDGIAVRTQGATLTIMHPRSAVVSMSGSSAVAARYIDEDTGQVTITSVYGQ
jgi:hypothetical protein